jgi:hypothetical protein
MGVAVMPEPTLRENPTEPDEGGSTGESLSQAAIIKAAQTAMRSFRWGILNS